MHGLYYAQNKNGLSTVPFNVRLLSMLSTKQLLKARNKAIYEAFTAEKPHKKRQKFLAECYGLTASRIKAIVAEQKKIAKLRKE